VIDRKNNQDPVAVYTAHCKVHRFRSSTSRTARTMARLEQSTGETLFFPTKVYIVTTPSNLAWSK